MGSDHLRSGDILHGEIVRSVSVFTLKNLMYHAVQAETIELEQNTYTLPFVSMRMLLNGDVWDSQRFGDGDFGTLLRDAGMSEKIAWKGSYFDGMVLDTNWRASGLQQYISGENPNILFSAELIKQPRSLLDLGNYSVKTDAKGKLVTAGMTLVQHGPNGIIQLNANSKIGKNESQCKVRTTIDDGRGGLWLMYENDVLQKIQVSHPAVARILGRDDHLLTEEDVKDGIQKYNGVFAGRDWIFGSPFVDISQPSINNYPVIQKYIADRFNLAEVQDIEHIQTLGTLVACKRLIDESQSNDLVGGLIFGSPKMV